MNLWRGRTSLRPPLTRCRSPIPIWILLAVVGVILIPSTSAIRCMCSSSAGGVNCYSNWCEVHKQNGKVGACAVVRRGAQQHFACVRVKESSDDSCKVDLDEDGSHSVRCWCKSGDYCNVDLADRIDNDGLKDSGEDDVDEDATANVFEIERNTALDDLVEPGVRSHPLSLGNRGEETTLRNLKAPTTLLAETTKREDELLWEREEAENLRKIHEARKQEEEKRKVEETDQRRRAVEEEERRRQQEAQEERRRIEEEEQLRQMQLDEERERERQDGERRLHEERNKERELAEQQRRRDEASKAEREAAAARRAEHEQRLAEERRLEELRKRQEEAQRQAELDRQRHEEAEAERKRISEAEAEEKRKKEAERARGLPPRLPAAAEGNWWAYSDPAAPLDNVAIPLPGKPPRVQHPPQHINRDSGDHKVNNEDANTRKAPSSRDRHVASRNYQYRPLDVAPHINVQSPEFPTSHNGFGIRVSSYISPETPTTVPQPPTTLSSTTTTASTTTSQTTTSSTTTTTTTTTPRSTTTITWTNPRSSSTASSTTSRSTTRRRLTTTSRTSARPESTTQFAKAAVAEKEDSVVDWKAKYRRPLDASTTKQKVSKETAPDVATEEDEVDDVVAVVNASHEDDVGQNAKGDETKLDANNSNTISLSIIAAIALVGAIIAFAVAYVSRKRT